MTAIHIVNATTVRLRLHCKCGAAISIPFKKERNLAHDIDVTVFHCGGCNVLWPTIGTRPTAVVRLLNALSDLQRDNPGDGYEVQFEIEVTR